MHDPCFIVPSGAHPARSSTQNLISIGCYVAVGLFALGGRLSAADVSYYSVTKGQLFLQTNSNTGALKPGASSYFFAQATVAPNFVVFSAAIGLPINGSRGLSPMGNTTNLIFQDRAASPAALDSLYGNGSYSFSFFTAHDGSKTLPLTLSGSTYPVIPHLNNLSAVQVIDSSAPFSLTWDAFSGGTAADLIQLRIENSGGQVFGTAGRPGATNALDGTMTGITIPARTLSAGRCYLAHLLFEKVTSTNLTYTGAPGWAGYWRQTDFYLVTAGVGDATPPTIVSIIPANGATGVPVNVPMIVTFSEPMGNGFSMSVGGTTNSFSGTWSADRRTCTISSPYRWPNNTALNWSFNPSGTAPLLGDTAGNPLMSDLSTSFTTGTRILASVPPQPTLLNPGPPSNGVFRLLLSGESYRTYVGQFSPDLLNWTSFGTNISANSQIEFLDTNALPSDMRFYRILALP